MVLAAQLLPVGRPVQGTPRFLQRAGITASVSRHSSWRFRSCPLCANKALLLHNLFRHVSCLQRPSLSPGMCNRHMAVTTSLPGGPGGPEVPAGPGGPTGPLFTANGSSKAGGGDDGVSVLLHSNVVSCHCRVCQWRNVWCVLLSSRNMSACMYLCSQKR